MTANQALTGPNYVHTFRVYSQPDPDDEPWPDTPTKPRVVKPRAVKPKRVRCEWDCGRYTTNPDRICDKCRPQWAYERDRMSKGYYPMEKGTA